LFLIFESEARASNNQKQNTVTFPRAPSVSELKLKTEYMRVARRGTVYAGFELELAGAESYGQRLIGLEITAVKIVSSSWTVRLGPGLLARLESVASAGNSDNLGMMGQAIEDCAGGRYIAQQLSSFFNRPIWSHHGGTVFVAAYDDFKEDLAAFGRKDF
jgi:hypothetical protein